MNKILDYLRATYDIEILQQAYDCEDLRKLAFDIDIQMDLYHTHKDEIWEIISTNKNYEDATNSSFFEECQKAGVTSEYDLQMEALMYAMHATLHDFFGEKNLQETALN